MLKDNQRRMINSLLEKPFKKVVIDRLLIDQGTGKELLNEPDKVLRKTAEHFEQQFKKRNFDRGKITEEWEEVYEPIRRVKETWFKDLNSKITKEE
jgi:uncharacterized protein YecA (UPF0149 family)